MTKITREDIIRANAQGLRDKEYMVDFYSNSLQVAYNLGVKGKDISAQPTVTGYRYGEVPEDGISFNYREQESERGLSMASVEGAEESGITKWFFNGHGKKVQVSGILLPYTGSDDEALILATDYLTNYDNMD